MPQPVIDSLIQSAQQHGASDLLLEENGPPRVKLNGAVVELGAPHLTRAQIDAFWRDCGADPAQHFEFDAGYALADGSRFRVALFRQSGKLGATIRVIRRQIPNFESLGLPEHVIIPWLQRRSGLILFTGATGSGKSTSIASCLEWINAQHARHVVTLEDPIEYRFTSQRCLFTQREIGIDTKDFPTGLRAALRQAPDVLFIGEIRDAETALTALQACETGHLVFSTLHSSDCVDTLERLDALFPSDSRHSAMLLLSLQLIGIVSQMLLPRADGQGSTLVVEHLENTGGVRPWIHGAKLPEIRDFITRDQSGGTQSFLRSLLAAFHAGLIDEDTALAAAPNPGDMQRALRGLS